MTQDSKLIYASISPGCVEFEQGQGAWTDVTNVVASGLLASVSIGQSTTKLANVVLLGNGTDTPTLDLSDIPAGAVLEGIEVLAEGVVGAGDAVIEVLFKSGGNYVWDNLTHFANALGTLVIGSSTELGLDMDMADLLDPTMQVEIVVSNLDSVLDTTVQLGGFRLRVYYNYEEEVMSTSLAVRLNATLTATLQDTTDAISTPQDSPSISLDKAFANGTGADQADLIFRDTRTLSGTTPDTLDLAGTALKDAFGNSLAFARIKLIMIKNLDTTSVLAVGAGSNPLVAPWIATGDGVKVRPGGTLLLIAPDATAYAVVADTGDILTITPTAGGSYQIMIVGASA